MAESKAAGTIDGLDDGVIATSRAETALAALAPDERNRILQAARNLSGRKPWEWSGVYVISLPKAQHDYYLLTVTPDWRAIIRQTEEGRIEISDVVREETLRLFHERQGSSGAPK